MISLSFYYVFLHMHYIRAEATAQWVRAFASQAEGLMFKSPPRQTANTGSDSPTSVKLPNVRQ